MDIKTMEHGFDIYMRREELAALIDQFKDTHDVLVEREEAHGLKLQFRKQQPTGMVTVTGVLLKLRDYEITPRIHQIEGDS